MKDKSGARPTLQQLRRSRLASAFTGRDEELLGFEQNLRFGVEDPRRRFVVAVEGQGGMGKTSLLRQFVDIARRVGARTGWSDDTQRDAVEVMSSWVGGLDGGGGAFKDFTKHAGDYRGIVRTLETDPAFSSDVAELVARAVGKSAVVLGRRVPIAGAALDFVDEDKAGSAFGGAAAELAKRFGDKHDPDLLGRPLEVLTPMFLRGLAELDVEQVVLFLDTYEATSHHLESWLLDVLKERFGPVPGHAVLVVAGRDGLDANAWAENGDVISHLSLSPFSETEARLFLERRGVTSPRVVEVLLELSGRMPLLLATLATQPPDDDEAIADVSDTAVERFLRWVDDPGRRRIALRASLPRRLDRDVVGLLADPQESDDHWAWLITLPFVVDRGDVRFYHPTVREQMLRQLRRESPDQWQDLHRRLVEYYDRRRGDAFRTHNLDLGHQLAAECTYHGVSGDRVTTTSQVTFWCSVSAATSYAKRVAEAIRQAEHDAGAPHPLWGERMVEALESSDASCAELVDEVVKRHGAEMNDGEHARVLQNRFMFTERTQRGSGRLGDLVEACRLDPLPVSWLYLGSHAADRGETDLAVKSLGEAREAVDPGVCLSANAALADLWQDSNPADALEAIDIAIGLDPSDVTLKVQRIRIISSAGRHEAILPELETAADLHQAARHDVYHAGGKQLQQVGRHAEAELAYERAVQADPRCLLCWRGLGETAAESATYDLVTTPVERLGAACPDALAAMLGMAVAYNGAGLTEKAEAYFTTYVRDGPPNPNAYAHLAAVQASAGETAKAFVNLGLAIELEPGWSWPLVRRAVLNIDRGAHGAALADLNAGLLNSGCPDEARFWKAYVLRQLGRLPEALIEADLYHAAVSDDPDGLEQRAFILDDLGEWRRAIADHEAAIAMREVGTGRSAVWNSLGLLRSYLEDFDGAREDFAKGEEGVERSYNIAVAAWMGEHGDAAECVEVAKVGLASAEHGVREYGLAALHALAGDDDQALEGLRRALSEGETARAWARRDMAWHRMRARGDLQALVGV